MILKACSPSDDDFVEDAFTDKRARGSSKADEPVSKKNKKPAVSSKPSLSSNPSKPSGSSKTSKPVLSEDLKPRLNLRQNLQPNQKKFPMVKIKKFPGPLCLVIKDLTTDQEEAIKSLGFGSLLDFELNVMPRRLGHWLLERFDGKSGNLTVFGETITITPELVHRTFGFPMGPFAVDVRDVMKERSNESYIQWKKQFNASGSRLYVTKHLMPAIKKQIRKNDSGNLFKMNIIALFCTILSYVVSMGTLNIGVIPSLTDFDNVRQMDWCEYVLHYMKSERLSWKPGKYFYGPILLLEVITIYFIVYAYYILSCVFGSSVTFFLI